MVVLGTPARAAARSAEYAPLISISLRFSQPFRRKTIRGLRGLKEIGICRQSGELPSTSGGQRCAPAPTSGSAVARFLLSPYGYSCQRAPPPGRYTRGSLTALVPLPPPESESALALAEVHAPP